MNRQADGKHRILIVEPKFELAGEYAAKLRTWGYEVTVVDNHLQGLSQIEDHCYDLALVGMDSQQLDGCEFCWLVRRREEVGAHKYTGLILLSDREHFREINDQCFGIDDVLVKPFALSELRWRVLKNCERVTRQGQLQEFASQSLSGNIFEPKQLSAVLKIVVTRATRLKNALTLLPIELDGLELAEIGYGPGIYQEVRIFLVATLSGLLRSLDQIGRVGKGRYCVLAAHLKDPGIEGLSERLEKKLQDALSKRFPYLQIELKVSGITVSVEPDARFPALDASLAKLTQWLLQWGEGQAEIRGIRGAVLGRDDFSLQ